MHNATGPLHAKLDDLGETFGGCAGNVAYNLAHLGQPPRILSMLGSDDGQRYLDHLSSLDIAPEQILIMQASASARAVIVSEADGQQFTAFYPGVLPSLDQWSAYVAGTDLSNATFCLLLPLPFELMDIALMRATTNAPSVGRVICPGQYCEMYSEDELAQLCAGAHVLIANADEAQRLKPIVDVMPGHSRPRLITTDGPRPVRVESTHSSFEVKVPTTEKQAGSEEPQRESMDPTGCGDAFLAGMIHYASRHTQASSELDQNLDLLCSEQSVQAGIVQAQLCLRSAGGQAHMG